MQMNNVNDKTSNRRVALRVYEQANLFYQKIAQSQLNTIQPDFDGILNGYVQSRAADHSFAGLALPYSQSQENDTLNVNISASGIAFTGQEELQVGDYLLLRILLLSSMTVVMTCCKVVYCKPSNPHEINQYPYSIGAQFVNLTQEDSALLHSHVDKIKQQQLVVNGSIAALILVVLAMPGQFFALLVALWHQLLEITLHLLHLAFEFIEITLDHLIEHQFHTDTHDTQVIVFYIVVSAGLVGLFFLGRMSISGAVRWGKSLRLYGSRKKSSWLYFWGEQSMIDKIKIVGIAVTSIAAYIYLGM